MQPDVAIYVRVSTVEQNEASQRAEIERWLHGYGWTGASWYIDKGASGDDLNRPELERLRKDIFAGAISTIIVWKLDRLSRTIRDGLALLCEWCDRGLRVVSVTQQIDVSGTVGKMIAAILLGIAEMEQQDRRERQKVGIRVAKAKGVYDGRRPGSTKAKPAQARDLKALGLNGTEIATAMGVSRRTVARYLSGH